MHRGFHCADVYKRNTVLFGVHQNHNTEENGDLFEKMVCHFQKFGLDLMFHIQWSRILDPSIAYEAQITYKSCPRCIYVTAEVTPTMASLNIWCLAHRFLVVVS